MTLVRGSKVTGLEAAAEDLERDPNVQQLIASVRKLIFIVDPSIQDELKTLVGFSSINIRGPEDFLNVQLALEKIQAYRDRALSIHLDSLEKKSKLERVWTAGQQYCYLQQEVYTKSDSLKKAIVGHVLREVEEMVAEWDSVAKQSEAIIRNCRDSYNCIFTQADVAKQQWWQLKGKDLGEEIQKAKVRY